MSTYHNWIRYAALVVGDHRWECGPDEFDLRFTITKNQKSKPNKAEISIANLTKASRSELTVTGASVRLEAGYVGNASTIFIGEITHATTERWGRPRGQRGPYRATRDGGDVLSHVTARDAEKAFSRAYINKSFAAGTPRWVAVQAIAQALGLPIPKLQTDLVSGVYAGGAVLTGLASQHLDVLCRTLDLEWSIQDGTLQLLRIGAANMEPVVVLSPETGLLAIPGDVEDAVPRWQGRKKKKLAQQSSGLIKHRMSRIQRTCFLNPGLRVGRRVRLQEGQEQDGDYRVLEVQHSGDTRGEDWKSVVVMGAL